MPPTLCVELLLERSLSSSAEITKLGHCVLVNYTLNQLSSIGCKLRA